MNYKSRTKMIRLKGSGVAHLVEWSLPTPEIRGSNTVIGNFFTVNCIEKTKIKTQVTGNVTPNLSKARTGPRSAARFKPEVHPRSKLTKCPEQLA